MRGPARGRKGKVAPAPPPCGRALAGTGIRFASAPVVAKFFRMADDQFESGGRERVWDEYDWERFLQQQDRKTEKYMELLEKYLDDPNRDQIIAREMGWHHLLDENGKDWTSDIESLFAARPGFSSPSEEDQDETEDETEPSEDEDETETEDEFQHETASDDDDLDARQRQNPLYQAANALTIYLDQLFDDQETAAQQPAVARLTTNATLANVKLAAALSDDDVDELGMTIAYLKRALKAISTALEAAAHCRQERLLDDLQAEEVRRRIFQVRDGIVTLMGEYRTEWRRRYGQGT
jgi:hypothetical protein